MALYSPYTQKKKKVTAYDALKPRTDTASAPTQPNVFAPKPLTPFAKGGVPTSTIPETQPNLPVLPGKPVVPQTPPTLPKGGVPPSTIPEANGSGQIPTSGYQSPLVEERATIKQQMDGINNSISQLQQRLTGAQAMFMSPQQKQQLQQQLATLQATQKQLQQKYNDYAPTGGTGDQQAQIDQFNQYVAQQLASAGIPIPDATSVQNNPAFQAAVEAMKSGKPLADVAAQFRASLPAGYNFQVAPAGFNPQKGSVDPLNPTNIPDIQRGEQIQVGGTTINRTDLEKLLAGEGGLANKAAQSQYDELMKIIQSGGSLTPEQMKQLTDPFIKDSLTRQGAAERDALGALSARGFGTNAAAVTGSLSEIGRGYEAERTQKQADIIKENLMAGLEGKQRAVEGLGNLAKSEREARINAAQIGSKENIAQAEIEAQRQQQQANLKFAQDELFQQGKLTQAGLELDQNLKKYGLDLQKYQTDQGFDLEMAKQDLQQRLAQAGLDVDSAKMQADNVFKSLDVAIQDKRIDADVNQAIADLQLRAAQGDQDAKFKVDSLRVEQDLRQQGLDHELSMFVADLAYRIQSGRERMDLEKWMFLKELDARLKEQNKGGGLGGFLGTVIGGVVGAATGGFGTAIGAKIGGSLFNNSSNNSSSGRTND